MSNEQELRSKEKSDGRYEPRVLCALCDHELNPEEECYNDGVCPYCGHVSGHTVCDIKVRAVFVPTRPSLFRRIIEALS